MLRVYKEFTEISTRRQNKLETVEDANALEEKERLFECLEANCNVFSIFSDFEVDMDLGRHSKFVNKKSVYDTLRRERANAYCTVTTNV